MATSIQILRQIKCLDEKQNQLIIMDKVFGLADNSDDWLVFWQFRETLNTAVFMFLHYLSRNAKVENNSFTEENF